VPCRSSVIAWGATISIVRPGPHRKDTYGVISDTRVTYARYRPTSSRNGLAALDSKNRSGQGVKDGLTDGLDERREARRAMARQKVRPRAFARFSHAAIEEIDNWHGWRLWRDDGSMRLMRPLPVFPSPIRRSFEVACKRCLVPTRPTRWCAPPGCGAELIALDVAGVLELRRRVVLPFAPERFRQTSVTDRPGDWGPLFDRIIGEVRAEGDLVVLGLHEGDLPTYAAANEAILNEAEALAGGEPWQVVAVIVWEGRVRGPDDLTEAFATLARARGHAVREVLTV
jgi:hypothetical protein